jgi:hypothetical protein
LIISLAGRGRVGKDTFAEILAEEIFNSVKKRFVLMAYANELKNRVQKDFDLSYEQLWGNQKEVPDKRYPKVRNSTELFWTPREIMQDYGEFYRSIDYDFWVKELFRVIDEKEYNNVIITDVRHPNEATPVINRGGLIIKITSNRENKEQVHGENHISETAMDNYDQVDFHIINDGSIEDLRVTAQQVVKFIIDSQKR